MGLLYHLYLSQFLIFTLVLARVSGLVMTAPIFGSKFIPLRIRALLAVSLSLMITPMFWDAQFEHPANLASYLILAIGELIVGLVIGLGIMILFSGIQIAGQLIASLSGMALADVFNPGNNQNEPLFSQLLFFVTLAVFTIIGGHRIVMDALLDTFVWIPPGSGGVSSSIVQTMTTLVAQSFALGIRASAPVVTALLLSILVMGLISRTLPQLNIMAFGFGLNSLMTLAMLSISLGAMAFLFQGHIESALDLISGALRSGRVEGSLP